MIISELFEAPQQCPECGGISFSDLILAEKKDACYHKVKASAKVWPSAYASGRLVQCRKKGAANYGNKSESVAEGVLDEAVGMMIKGAAISGPNDQDIADRIAARTGGRVDSGSRGHHILITYPTPQHRAMAAAKIRKMFPGIELYKSGGNRNAIDEQGMAEGMPLGKVLSFPDLLGQVKHILDAKHGDIGWKMSKRDDDVFLFSAMNDYNVRSMLVVAKDRDGWVSATNGMVDPYGEVEMFGKQELPMTLASASEIADEAISTYHDIDLSDYADEDEQGMAEGKKKSDTYHIVNKDGKPASLASYADQASAVKDRDAKHPGAEVRQLGPRGKVKGVAEGSLNEFAIPGGSDGDSERWYTDNELADIIGDDWFEDFDVSNDGFNIDAYGEKAKKNLVGYANAWFNDKGYNVNVMGVEHNDVDHDLQWYIVGSFYNPRFANKGVAEGYQLDEGAVETITALVKKIPGIGKYYQMAQQYKPQLIEILKTSKSGKEVKQKMEQLAAGQSATVAESGMMKQLGGLAVGGGSILSTMWMNAMGMIDGVLAHAAAGEVGGAVASGSILGLIPVTLMLFAAMLMFKGSKQSSDEKAQAFQAQRGQQGVAEGVMYGAENLHVGDDVVISGDVNLKGATGVIDSFGQDNRFVVVNLYNHGKHSFHSSDVSANDHDNDEHDDEQGVAEGEQRKGADYRDPKEVDYDDEYDAMVARVKKLAGLGPMKTVYDPAKRQYRNMPTAVQPKK